MIFLLYVLFAAVVVYFIPKKESVLYLNNVDSLILDYFFRYATRMGEVLGGAIVTLIILFNKPMKYVIFFLLAITLASGSANILKRTVFTSYKRPAAHFEEQIKPINGNRLHKLHSFPSGHTTAAFCFFSFMAFAMRKKTWQLIGVGLACLAGISRVYLAQHFPEDVMAGAILGTVVSTLVFLWIPANPRNQWLNKRLIEDNAAK